jgi:hypothetical protein
VIADQDFAAWLRQFMRPAAQAAADRPPSELTPDQVLAEVRDALTDDGWIAVALREAGRPLRRHHLPFEPVADRYVSSLAAIAGELTFQRNNDVLSDKELVRRFDAAGFDLKLAAHNLETGYSFASRAQQLPYSERELLDLIGPCYSSAVVHLRLAADIISGRFPLRHSTPA